ncbi:MULTISPECIES: hypothetical protein [Methylobacter]
MRGSLFVLLAVGVILIAAVLDEIVWRYRFKKQQADFISRLQRTESDIDQGARSTSYKLKTGA